MANRFFEQFRWSLEKNVTDIYAYVTFGAAGACTLSTSATKSSKGVVSVTHDGTGLYTFVFGTNAAMLDTYYKLLDVNVTWDGITDGDAPLAPLFYLSANSIATVGTASLQLTLTASNGTATDPEDTDAAYFHFTFGNSSAY